MDPATGTFTTMDTYGGSLSDPMSLHKYLFANSNPVMYSDPSGHYTLTQQETAIAIQAIIGEAMSGIFYIADWLLTDPESQNHSVPMMIITMMIGLAQGAVMGSWGGLLTGLISKAGLSILDYLLTGIMFTLFSWDLKLAAMNMKESGNWLVAVLCDAGGDFAGVVAFASIYNGIAKGWNALKNKVPRNWTNNKKGYVYIGDGAGNTAESTGRNKLALGLSDYLDDFASKNGATTWKDFPDPQNWQNGVLDALYNPNTDIIINLDGIDNPYLAIQRAASGYGGATDWELLQIKLTPEAWSRTTWYLNGEVVPNPFNH